MKKIAILIGIIFSTPLTLQGQGFSSGSTGSDGPLDLAALSCSNCTLQVPPSGVFNFTTVNIPSGKQLSFTANLQNTPVVILAQGNVVVAGQILISGGSLNSCSGGSGGMGGFAGGSSCTAHEPGFGPGGGRPDLQQPANRNGKWVGPLSLVPIVGGSGGAGCCSGSGGGGGGGALVLASSSTISISGIIFADGACGFNSTGDGSGGAVRLVANSITVSGSIFARGCSSSNSNFGVIRLESPAGSFTGQANPPPILSTTINPTIVANNNTPSLTITSIAGFAAPSNPAARSDFVDLMLPSQLSDPISVVVHGRNLPVGTQVQMTIGGSHATVTSGTLAGTFDLSTATLNVSGLSRTSVSTLFVFAIVATPSSLQALNPKGANRVARIRIEATLGGASKFAFLRANGSMIDAARLPPKFLSQFIR